MDLVLKLEVPTYPSGITQPGTAITANPATTTENHTHLEYKQTLCKCPPSLFSAIIESATPQTTHRRLSPMTTATGVSHGFDPHSIHSSRIQRSQVSLQDGCLLYFIAMRSPPNCQATQNYRSCISKYVLDRCGDISFIAAGFMLRLVEKSQYTINCRL